MFKFIRFGLILSFVGCTTLHKSINRNDFIDYTNDNKISIGIDGTIIKDRNFKIKLPQGLVSKHIIIETAFMQVFSYKAKEKIIILYRPSDKKSSMLKKQDISYTEFISLCEKEDITRELKNIRLDKHRRFGLYKSDESQFYTIYLNVKPDNLAIFDYSINSINY